MAVVNNLTPQSVFGRRNEADFSWLIANDLAQSATINIAHVVRTVAVPRKPNERAWLSWVK